MRKDPIRAVVNVRYYPAPRTRDGRKMQLHLACGHILYRNGGQGLPRKAHCYWCGLPAGSDVPRDVCWQ